MPDPSFAGRRVLVTGAASGLGRAFAFALGAAGTATVLADRDATVREVAAEIAARGGTAHAVLADVSDEASVAALASAVRDALGSLDVLVNNAGIAIPPARLPDVAVADWDRVIAANLRSVFLCARALLPLLLQGTDPAIINVGSVVGRVGLYPGFPVATVAYAASKAGIEGLTRQLAAEYAREGLRVNAIAPGFHGGTGLGRERRAAAAPGMAERYESFLRDAIPMGRRGTPEELTSLLLYLAGRSSSYVTGQIFTHDGGLTAA